MPPAKHTAQEETAFMQELLSGLDSSVFDALPSPDKPKKPCSKSRRVQSPVRHATITPKQSRYIRVASSHKLSPLAASNVSNVLAETDVAGDGNISLLLEGAEDWDWEDMHSDFLTPKKAPRKQDAAFLSPDEEYHAEICTRCIVKAVHEVIADGKMQKELTVNVEPSNERRRIILRDDWLQTNAREGDIINILGAFGVPLTSCSNATIPTIEVASKSNLLIHHPDILITATSLANALQCRRKPLLQTLVRSSAEITPALVWGNILHEVMQTCLREERWDEPFTNGKIEEIIRKNLSELLKIDVTVEQAFREIKLRATGLKVFAERYISSKPKSTAILTNTRASSNQESLLSITGLLDIEEDIWSPTYGLKGKLDASVTALVEEVDRSTDPWRKSICPTTRTLSKHKFPFEIKTGRAVAGLEHRAQTMLYTLLMSERYASGVQSGLLYYTQSEEVVRVPAARNEIRALIIARNEMAEYMVRRSSSTRGVPHRGGDKAPDIEDCAALTKEPFLPPTLNDARTCGQCYVVDTCMLYRKAVEGAIGNVSPIKDIYDLKTSHLTDEQASFFKTWERLITLEEQELTKFKKELWTMSATEREAKGRCFSNMKLDPTYVPTGDEDFIKRDKIHQYTYRLVRSGGSSKDKSLLNGHISRGDPITVSIEPDLLAFARGFVLQLTPNQVIVGVDHDLSAKNVHMRRPNAQHRMPFVYRIDKDELSSGMSRVRDNLAQLFYREGDSRRRELIVDLKKPVFEDMSSFLFSEQRSLCQQLATLNASQQAAMRRVIGARDYALILGMPGTGKTTVVAAVIMALVSMGKSILLTSYTHSAVDTILLKLKDIADFPILRLGNRDKIHPDVLKFTLAACREATSVEQLEQQVMTPPVIATTCLSIDHPLFLRRRFDYCIVDEASQITLPTCLGPLRYANRFVLVGDHFQLPPLVKNASARTGGLDVSLFRRLSEAHSDAVVDLSEQYRMNEDIMVLSNKLIYGDRLRCGTEEVATRCLVLPKPEYIKTLHDELKYPHDNCWLERLLDPQCKAVFVDTDAVPAEDSRVGDLVQNVTEAQLVYQVTECLLRSGVKGAQIGIISLYRQQVKLISHLLQEHQNVEILTADRSQGRDKDCIIVSMVRSNKSGLIGDLLKDWRRINVSFTRARSKLIIFGSRRTLKEASIMQTFFCLMDSHNWVLKLPPDANKLHEFVKLQGMQKRSLGDINAAGESANAAREPKRIRRSDTKEGVLQGGGYILKDVVNDNR